MKSTAKLGCFCTGITLAALTVSTACAVEFSGSIGADARWFDDGDQLHSSVFIEPAFYWQSEDGNNLIDATLFARADNTDDQRSSGDIRELKWIHVADEWELHTGIGKVFWGVAESNHLVDVINQSDQVQSAEGGHKLGQPMLHWSLLKDWGTVDAFVLPYFRERTFAGVDGRPAGPLPIDQDNAQYQSSQEEEHLDYAFRYSHTLGDWDYGLSYFKGTNRNPQLQIAQNAQAQTVLRPYYNQIEQVGIDLQATKGSWLWKAEAIAQGNPDRDYVAAVGGFEYTLVGIAESDADVGLLAELHRDSRGADSGVINDKDVFLAARFTLNDVQDSNLLIGVSQSVDNSDSRLAFIEGNRRFGDNWRGTVDARLFDSETPSDPLYSFREEDHMSVTVEYFF